MPRTRAGSAPRGVQRRAGRPELCGQPRRHERSPTSTAPGRTTERLRQVRVLERRRLLIGPAAERDAERGQVVQGRAQLDGRSRLPRGSTARTRTTATPSASACRSSRSRPPNGVGPSSAAMADSTGTRTSPVCFREAYAALAGRQLWRLVRIARSALAESGPRPRLDFLQRTADWPLVAARYSNQASASSISSSSCASRRVVATGNHPFLAHARKRLGHRPDGRGPAELSRAASVS